MRIRVAAVAATLACTGPGTASLAAPAKRPQIVDAIDDETGLGPSYDVRTALFATSGYTVRNGKRTTYVPTRLVVTVTYGAAPARDAYAAQVVAFATEDCQVYLEAYGDTTTTYGSASCVEGAFAVPVSEKGTTLTFTLPLGALGHALRPGVKLAGLSTWTNVAEPRAGYETGDLVGTALTVDYADAKVTYVVQ